MTDKQKIEILRIAVMVAVVELYDRFPKDVLKSFEIADLKEIVEKTEALRPRQVENIYYEALKTSA